MGIDPRFPSRRRAGLRRFLFRARHCRGDRSSICLRGDATADTSEFRALVRCSDNAPSYFRCFAVVRRPGDRTNDRTPRHHYPARPRPPKKCRPAKGKRPSRCATMLRIGNRPPGARRSRALRPLIKAQRPQARLLALLPSGRTVIASNRVRNESPLLRPCEVFRQTASAASLSSQNLTIASWYASR